MEERRRLEVRIHASDGFWWRWWLRRRECWTEEQQRRLSCDRRDGGVPSSACCSSADFLVGGLYWGSSIFVVLPIITMKHSRTPRSSGSGNPGQKNFRRMKKRLQLRAREGDKSNEQQDHYVGEQEPIAIVPPPTDNDPAADEDGDPDVHEDADAAQADDVGGHCNAEAEFVGKKTNQSGLFNRSSPMKIVRVCKKMTAAQQDLIKKADFGDMLRMKCSKLMPELCRFLMGCFNPTTCELDFGDRGRIPVTAESAFRIMGVPMGAIPVPYHLDVDATGLILEMFGISSGGQPSVRRVEKELGPTFPADQAYLRKFVIYMMSSVFAPTTCINVSPKFYPSVINTQAIRRFNWARFIVDILIETGNAKDKKNWFKACMPYLMILYVDSLETNAIEVPSVGTRSTVWTNQMIKLVVDLDTKSDGTFGKLPLKACFRSKISLFSCDSSTVDMFIKQHIPGSLDEEGAAH